MLCLAMAAVPVLALTHASGPPATPQAVASARPVSRIAGDEAALARATADRASRSDVPDTTEAPTTTVAPTTTTAARPPYKPTLYRAAPRQVTTTAPRRATTTSRPAARPAATPRSTPTSAAGPRPTPAPAPAGNSQTGGASWYDAAPPGTCAHRTLPKGTVVHITDLSNGATATCTVEDRGPY